MAHDSIKHSVPQLMISLAMLYHSQPTRLTTVVAVTALGQLGRHYPTLQPMNLLQQY